jgi:hypothetical protein
MVPRRAATPIPPLKGGGYSDSGENRPDGPLASTTERSNLRLSLVFGEPANAAMNRIKHLLIVGAGFSSHAGLPLTTEFTRQLLDTKEFTSDSPSALLVKFLRKFVAETFDHDEKSSQLRKVVHGMFSIVVVPRNSVMVQKGK